MIKQIQVQSAPTLSIFSKLPNRTHKFSVDKMYDTVKPFWRFKDYSEQRTTNSVGYHGTSEKAALKILKRGKLPKGTYVTSNPIDATYWAAMAGDSQKCGGVVFKLQVGQISLGDDRDNGNHAILKSETKAEPFLYIPDSDISIIISRL